MAVTEETPGPRQVSIIDELLALPPHERDAQLREWNDEDRAAIFTAARRDYGTPFVLWRDDPVGFIETVLHEFVWSKQREICESVRDHRRTAVPATNGPGKSHLAGRIVAWWVSVHQPGEAMAVTTATRWVQVRTQLWPHIRAVHAKAGLPGICDQVEWKIDTEFVALGFASNRYEEAAGQGFHAPKLLIVVDEGGGIPYVLGSNFDSLMTNDEARILVIGNPPTDEEGTWFEHICDESPLWKTIRIDAYSTPNFTGETIPDGVARQLTSKQWVADVIHNHGEDSGYYQARVLAQFPKGTATKTIPVSWLDEVSVITDKPSSPKFEDLDLNLDDSDWQRLGVDVASDGGDEFVIALADGPKITIQHFAHGADNASQVDVAERVLEEIRRAEATQRARGYVKRKVRVKIDATGIGRGAADMLVRWRRDKDKDPSHAHDAEIVYVNNGEKAIDSAQYLNKRAESWWNLRTLIRDRNVWLEVDEATFAQLAGPMWSSNAGGKTSIERKVEMKKRGLASPDRADAVVLTVYEPDPAPPAHSYTLTGMDRRLPSSPRSRW